MQPTGGKGGGKNLQELILHVLEPAPAAPAGEQNPAPPNEKLRKLLSIFFCVQLPLIIANVGSWSMREGLSYAAQKSLTQLAADVGLDPNDPALQALIKAVAYTVGIQVTTPFLGGANFVSSCLSNLVVTLGNGALGENYLATPENPSFRWINDSAIGILNGLQQALRGGYLAGNGRFGSSAIGTWIRPGNDEYLASAPDGALTAFLVGAFSTAYAARRDGGLKLPALQKKSWKQLWKDLATKLSGELPGRLDSAFGHEFFSKDWAVAAPIIFTAFLQSFIFNWLFPVANESTDPKERAALIGIATALFAMLYAMDSAVRADGRSIMRRVNETTPAKMKEHVESFAPSTMGRADALVEYKRSLEEKALVIARRWDLPQMLNSLVAPCTAVLSSQVVTGVWSGTEHLLRDMFTDFNGGNPYGVSYERVGYLCLEIAAAATSFAVIHTLLPEHSPVVGDGKENPHTPTSFPRARALSTFAGIAAGAVSGAAGLGFQGMLVASLEAYIVLFIAHKGLTKPTKTLKPEEVQNPRSVEPAEYPPGAASSSWGIVREPTRSWLRVSESMSRVCAVLRGRDLPEGAPLVMLTADVVSQNAAVRLGDKARDFEARLKILSFGGTPQSAEFHARKLLEFGSTNPGEFREQIDWYLKYQPRANGSHGMPTFSLVILKSRLAALSGSAQAPRDKRFGVLIAALDDALSIRQDGNMDLPAATAAQAEAHGQQTMAKQHGKNADALQGPVALPASALPSGITPLALQILSEIRQHGDQFLAAAVAVLTSASQPIEDVPGFMDQITNAMNSLERYERARHWVGTELTGGILPDVQQRKLALSRALQRRLTSGELAYDSLNTAQLVQLGAALATLGVERHCLDDFCHALVTRASSVDGFAAQQALLDFYGRPGLDEITRGTIQALAYHHCLSVFQKADGSHLSPAIAYLGAQFADPGDEAEFRTRLHDYLVQAMGNAGGAEARHGATIFSNYRTVSDHELIAAGERDFRSLEIWPEAIIVDDAVLPVEALQPIADRAIAEGRPVAAWAMANNNHWMPIVAVPDGNGEVKWHILNTHSLSEGAREAARTVKRWFGDKMTLHEANLQEDSVGFEANAPNGCGVIGHRMLKELDRAWRTSGPATNVGRLIDDYARTWRNGMTPKDREAAMIAGRAELIAAVVMRNEAP
jgi:hypothetical protein